MLTILSPAKTLNLETQELVSEYTIPAFLDDSTSLAMELKYSVSRLAELMKISLKLAKLNFERYKVWGPPFNTSNAKQAI